MSRNYLTIHINGVTLHFSYDELRVEQSNHVYRQPDGSYVENTGEDRNVEITVTGAVPVGVKL